MSASSKAEEILPQVNMTVESSGSLLNDTFFFNKNLANTFLNIFFDELETGIDQVLSKTSLKDSKLVTPQALATETTRLLKKEV
jgi:hypothetical protein